VLRLPHHFEVALFNVSWACGLDLEWNILFLFPVIVN